MNYDKLAYLLFKIVKFLIIMKNFFFLNFFIKNVLMAITQKVLFKTYTQSKREY